jgi:urea transport system substrate-binding protein
MDKKMMSLSWLCVGGVIINTLNGDSNTLFFTAMYDRGLRSNKHPVISLSLSEPEISSFASKAMGHYAIWSYLQSLETTASTTFATSINNRYGDELRISDPMNSAYAMIHLWAAAANAIGHMNASLVRSQLYGMTFDAPEGGILVNDNHHISKPMRMAIIGDDGYYHSVEQWGAILPSPWSDLIPATMGHDCDWSLFNRYGDDAGFIPLNITMVGILHSTTGSLFTRACVEIDRVASFKDVFL